MDQLVDIVHSVATMNLVPGLGLFADFCLNKFQFSVEFMTLSHAIFAITKVYETNDAKATKDQKMYWLHSFILCLISSFGGGFLAPLLIGKTALPVANDLVIPFVAFVWYTTHYMGLLPVYNLIIIKPAWTCGEALFRTHSVCNMVATTAAMLSPGKYYPVALCGPIIVGTSIGSLGAFLPFTKGLAPIEKSMAWPMQGAFFGAVFYHLMVNDHSGILGCTLRGVVGNWSEGSTRVIIASVHIVTNLLHMFFSPEANLFTPLHRVLYMVLNVKGPSETATPAKGLGMSLDRFIEAGRVLIVLLALFMHMYVNVPPVSLQRGTMLLAKGPRAHPQGVATVSSIGSCHWLGAVRPCTAHTLSLSTQDGKRYSLASYSADNSTRKWEKTVTTRDAAYVAAMLGENGILRVVQGTHGGTQEKELWRSRTTCGSAASATKVALDPSGSPAVICTDGSSILIDEK